MTLDQMLVCGLVIFAAGVASGIIVMTGKPQPRDSKGRFIKRET